MSTRLVIDYNHLAHRNWAVNGHLSSKAGERVGCVFGVLKSLRMFCDRFQPSEVIFCRDMGKSFRRELLESYKGSRGTDLTPEQVAEADDRFEQFEKTEAMLETLGLPVIGIDSIEADDLCAILSKRLPNGVTIVISGDKDLLQLVDQSTKYYNPGYDKLVSLTGWRPQPGEDFSYKFNREKEVHPDAFTRKSEGIIGGVDFSKWTLYRALVGDSSDELSGIKGIGPVAAMKILPACQSWQEVVQKKATLGLSARVQEQLTEQNLGLQVALIDLDLIANSSQAEEILPTIREKMERRPADLQTFRRLLIKYDMNSILVDQRLFLKNIPILAGEPVAQ
jgi:5'-3' exonuclease